MNKKDFFHSEYIFTWAAIIFLKQFHAYLIVLESMFTIPHRRINSYSSANRMVIATTAPAVISTCLVQKHPRHHNISLPIQNIRG
jgi:hypothetical protein